MEEGSEGMEYFQGQLEIAPRQRKQLAWLKQHVFKAALANWQYCTKRHSEILSPGVSVPDKRNPQDDLAGESVLVVAVRGSTTAKEVVGNV